MRELASCQAWLWAIRVGESRPGDGSSPHRAGSNSISVMNLVAQGLG